MDPENHWLVVFQGAIPPPGRVRVRGCSKNGCIKTKTRNGFLPCVVFPTARTPGATLHRPTAFQEVSVHRASGTDQRCRRRFMAGFSIDSWHWHRWHDVFDIWSSVATKLGGPSTLNPLWFGWRIVMISLNIQW